MMKFGKKHPLLMIVIGAAMVGLIFLLRSASDTLNAETSIAEGQEFYRVGNCEEAVKYYNNALELDSTNYGGYFSRGLCYKENGRLLEALNDYNDAIRLSPKSDRKTLYFTRGEINHMLENFDAACKDMRMAKQLGSADAATYLQLHCVN